MALKANGDVIVWGVTTSSNAISPLSRVTAYALKSNGTIVCWGRNNFGQAKIPNGISKAGAISVSYVNSVIGLRDASVIAFGDASLGALVSRTPTVTP